MKPSVYRITNTVTGLVYIGKSKMPRVRWIAHKTLARSTTKKKAGLPLYCDIRKYGEGAFLVEVLSEHETDELAFAAEALAVKDHRSNDPAYGYNCNEGGFRGWTQSASARKRMSEVRTGHPVSEAQREKMRRALTGQKRTAEQRARIGAASKGRRWSDEARQKASLSHRGKKRTPAQRENYKAGAAKRIAKQRCIKAFAYAMAGVEMPS